MVVNLAGELALSPTQQTVREQIGTVCQEFDDNYWRERDAKEEYPYDFVNALAEDG